MQPTTKTFLRASRAAKSIPRGEEIFAWLQSKGRARLIGAARHSIPPVAAVSKHLVDLVGPEVLRSMSVKQFVGMAVNAVLSQEGYGPVKTGVRIRGDQVFSTGAVYGWRGSAPKIEDPLLRRLLVSLSPEEMQWAVDFLTDRIVEHKKRSRR
jgi:hypothetical protein